MESKIMEMLKIQENLLNQSIQKYKKTELLKPVEVRMELFDNLGEICHLMKPEWSWKKSNESAKTIDNVELKKALIKVWQSALVLHGMFYGYSYNHVTLKWLSNYLKYCDWFEMLQYMYAGGFSELYCAVILTDRLGFSFEEIYSEFLAMKEKQNVSSKNTDSSTSACFNDYEIIIQKFADDLYLETVDPDTYSLSELIQSRNKDVIKDINLLNELAFLIRNGKASIKTEEADYCEESYRNV